MTLTNIAEATGMTRASARRFLLTLVQEGYAEVLLRSLKRLDELGCSRQGFADMSTLDLLQKNYPLSGE